LPADIQARFLRIAERVVLAGLETLREPHVKHLEGKLWEMRLTGRDGIARSLRDGYRQAGRRGASVREKDPKNAAGRDRDRVAARQGNRMSIRFEEFKARLLANPEVKAEYEALAPEFEISAELIKARLRAGLSQANWRPAWGLANQQSPGWKADTACPAPRRCCALPRRPAAKCRCG
jgi:hypothetical protein